MNNNQQKPKDAVSDAAGRKKRQSTRAQNTQTSDDLIIVGIGASAGGLDALQRVLPGLPAESGMAYVIVQHLAPKHHSLLPSLLAKHTAMPVETITDGLPVRPDTIFITPPNKDVTLAGKRLKLRPVASIGPRPSIDNFFTSLAEEKKAHAVGIILSGTGTDGSHGIRAIKSNDGITMAQTADSAKFDGMPQAAMDTGLVDLVLPPEKIGQELETALKYPNLIAKTPPDTHTDEISSVLDLLQQRTGVDFSDYKPATIYRRISRRMVIHKLHSLQDYAAYTRNYPEELALLQKDLLISVTRFFRDAQAFEALAHRLRGLFEHKQAGDTFRVWVPGCSTGEEAYSIAILVAEILGQDLGKYRIQIFATDLDEDSVQQARKGVYPVATVMDTDGRRFEKHFSHRDNTVTVKKHIRDMVILARQDLIQDTPFLHLDLISCRNLMIYLTSELQDRLLALFQFSLNPDGLLFLGKSESINQRRDLFKIIDSRWKIFRRKQGPAQRLSQLMQSRQPAQAVSHRPQRKKPSAGGGRRDSVFADSLLDLLDCCAVLTDEHANILYIRGDVNTYLRFPQGSVRHSLNAIEMARPEIRFVLQSALHRSAKEARTVISNPVALGSGGRGVQIRVGPLRKEAAAGDRMIVFIQVETPQSDSRCTSSDAESDPGRVRELEQELEITREHLQDTIEELETSSEELQSLNEELQSSNEELQASNEELETSNEELQASNEELNTVNDELRAKSAEADELLQDLKKSERRYRLLVDHMNEALMLCELEYGRQNRPTDLIIKQANRALEQLVRINANELPLRAGSAHLHELVTGEMLQRFVAIAGGGDPQRIEVHLKALAKDLTLSAYNLDGGRVGIICRDDTQRKKSEAALQASEQRARDQLAELEAIYASAPVGLCIFDENLRFLRINQRLAEINGVPPEAHIGRTVREVVPDLAGQAEKLQHRILETGEGVYDIEFVGETPSLPGVERTWTEQWLPLKDDQGRVKAINVVAQEITERKQAETKLLESEERLRTSLEEKEVLLKEIHHRVKNNMQVISSLASLQSSEIQDDTLREILLDVTNRVRSMAMIHEKLYESADLARVHFADYTRGLMSYLWRAHGSAAAGIRLELDLEPVKLPVNAAVPCGLILNELVGNALKHAFDGADQGRVVVSLHTVGNGRVRLGVRDDGRGLPADFDWGQTRSLGLRLVQMLVGQLNAQVDVSGAGGTEFAIAFEVPNNGAANIESPASNSSETAGSSESGKSDGQKR